MIWILSLILIVVLVGLFVLNQKFNACKKDYTNLTVSWNEQHVDYINNLKDLKNTKKLLDESATKNIDLTGKYSELNRINRINLEKIESLHQKITNEAAEKRNEILAARQDAVDTQRSVVKGKMAEELSPLMPEFPFNIKDLRFSGQPIDYLCYAGLSNDDIQEIVFIECKSGEAVLNARQRQIEKVIKEGKVRFEIFRIK